MATIEIIRWPNDQRGSDFWIIERTERGIFPLYGPYETREQAEPRHHQVLTQRQAQAPDYIGVYWHHPKILAKWRAQQMSIARSLANLRGLGGAIGQQLADEFALLDRQREAVKLHRRTCKGCEGGELQ